MGLDYLLIRSACAQWRHAELRYLPRSPVEPVIWIDNTQSFRMYHPALSLDNMRVNRDAWHPSSFAAVVAQVIAPASQIISDELASTHMPPSFYAQYPDIVQQNSLPESEIEELPPDIIEVR